MCGIAGIIDGGDSSGSRHAIERMTASLVHRGPDDSGIHVSGRVALGFRRLSILDLTESAHQPMTAPDLPVTIVFNGEIYNYVELRGELEDRGHRFRSSGDTEVLLRAWCEWGDQCVERLNGMWAFLIHDERRAVVFGSRDRFGIKPLFRYRGASSTVLASEIKAIVSSGLYEPETNWRTASRFLLDERLDDTPETFFEGIESVEAGTTFEIGTGAGGDLRERRFWSLDPIEKDPPPDPAGAFAECFEDAIRLHMRSDVPVGVNLSGGLDSTSILCASARVRAAVGTNGDLEAFCYMAPEFDETPYIDATLAQTGATLHRLETSARRLWDDLEVVLRFQDEPVHSMTAVVGYQLMRIAADRGVKVLLNGQGADETLGGYPSYFRDYWHTVLTTGGLRQAWDEISRYSRHHGGDRITLAFRQAVHFALTLLARGMIYRASRRWHRRRRTDPWFEPHLAELRLAGDEEGDPRWDLDGSLVASTTRAPLPLYLRVEDRNSMAHSIEARVPFLDPRLVTLAFRLSADWRMRGEWNKFVLRESMRGRIPENVRARVDKMGFPTPVAKWVIGDLYEPIREILTARDARERGAYDTSAIMRDLDAARRGGPDCSARVFRVVEFELWNRCRPAPP